MRHASTLSRSDPLTRPELDGKIDPGTVFDLQLPLGRAADGDQAMDERHAIKPCFVRDQTTRPYCRPHIPRRTMEYRFLGDSGLKVSAISYGPWVTAQGREEQATACIRAALDADITTFDTADTYANGGAETILGDALAGERRASLEILTKVFGATGPGGPNDSGLSRKHIHESINASLTRLKTDYVDLYQAHRYDFSTPLEETMEAFADVVRAGKALYIGVSEWTPDQLRTGHALARELKIPFISNQSKYNALFRIIEPDVIPTCQELGISQICFSPIEQGILTGK